MGKQSGNRDIIIRDIGSLESILLQSCLCKIELAEVSPGRISDEALQYYYSSGNLNADFTPGVPEKVILDLITPGRSDIPADTAPAFYTGVFEPGNGESREAGRFFIYRITTSTPEVHLVIGVILSGPFGHDEIQRLRSVLGLFDLAIGRRFEVERLSIESIKYNQLYSAAPEAIVTLDRDNCIQAVNPEFEKLFQYSQDQVLGRNLDELIAPDHLYNEASHLTSVNRKGGLVAVEARRMRRDGTLVDVSILGVPFDQGNGDLFLYGIYRDISERILNEKQRHNRIEFIEYMSRLSSELINLKIDSIDQAIEEALARVGRLHNAERSYLVVYSKDNGYIEISHEWAADQRFSHRERMPSILLNEIADYLNHLQSGETFYLQRTELGQREGTGELIFFFDLLDIESLVNIPLFVGHAFKGYIGFDTYSRPLEWDEQALNAFRLTGQILINALARKQTEQDIKDALQKAEASDKLKSAFLAGISHEVRTPMNHILGFLELLNDPYLPEQEQKEYIGIMKHSGMQLLRLIDHVIELAMIDSGQVRIIERPCDVSRLMESLMVEFEGMKSEMNRHKVKLRLRIAPECRGLIVRTDEIRLRQILWNLLSNAIKFTREGIVDVGFGLADYDSLEFFVRDSGIGIERENLELIFERFRQLDTGLSREFGGAGLGLSISQGLAALFGSKISVQSVAGTGSTFSFLIPYREYKPGLNGHNKMNGVSELSSWANKSILMVEDDPVNMRFLTVLFLRTGVNLLYASNGEEAIEVVSGNPVDLILMDMQMPVMDGFEATRIIKSRFPDIQILAQTAYALREEKSDCIAAGCDDFISKPIDKNTLYHKVDKLLKKKENNS